SDLFEAVQPIKPPALRGVSDFAGPAGEVGAGFVILPHAKLVPGTERWEQFSPWPATYWKTLPQGAHVTFEAQGDFTMKHPHTMEEERWYEFERWYTVPDEFKQPGYWS